LSPLAYRLKLGTQQQTSFMAGVIKVSGADLKDVKLSVKSTQQDRYE